MDAAQLQAGLPNTAFAFRGYELTNVGRSDELLAHRVYGSVVEEELVRAGEYYTEFTRRPIDLVDRVRCHRETTIETYAEANVLILAMELAHLRLLDELFGVRYASARVAYGFSVGELAALIAGGVFTLKEILRICLPLADDLVRLSADVSLGVLFSRGRELVTNEVRRLCLQINQQGRGVIAISAYLSPDSLLLMGQYDTLDRFAALMAKRLSQTVMLRKKGGHWVPLHTPIAWEMEVRTRFAVALHTVDGGFAQPSPPILSMMTGECDYDDSNTRAKLVQWVDQPQLLWSAVHRTLTMGIGTVIHVGPGPNIIRATFRRLRENVERQTNASLSKRTVSSVLKYPWLNGLLPEGMTLLRAIHLRHVVVEDWLLEQDV